MKSKEKTVLDVFNSMTKEQKKVVYFLIDESIKEEKNKYRESTIRMKIIKNLILRTNMSCSEIAEIVGVSNSYIYKIKHEMIIKGEI